MAFSDTKDKKGICFWLRIQVNLLKEGTWAMSVWCSRMSCGHFHLGSTVLKGGMVRVPHPYIRSIDLCLSKEFSEKTRLLKNQASRPRACNDHNVSRATVTICCVIRQPSRGCGGHASLECILQASWANMIMHRVRSKWLSRRKLHRTRSTWILGVEHAERLQKCLHHCRLNEWGS